MAGGEEISETESLFFRGSDLHGEGRHREAVECFDRCLELSPDYIDAMLGKAVALSALGEQGRALELAERVAELAPDDVLAYTNLSMFYQRAGMVTEAEEAGAKARMLEWKRELADGEGGD